MKPRHKPTKAGKATPKSDEARRHGDGAGPQFDRKHKQADHTGKPPKGKKSDQRSVSKEVSARTRVAKAIDSRTEVINKAKGQKIGLPFHTTPPELIAALTDIRDATPGCSARTQEDRLEKALHRWPLTSFEMLKWLDLYDPRARIQGLRLKGLVINRVWVLIETDCGQAHRVGRYAIQRGLTAPVVFPSQSDLFRETTCAAAGPAAVDGREVVV